MDKAASGCHRWGLLGVILAGAALLVAACGGGSSPTSAAQAAYQKMLAYSQCMRAHGEPGFPDPQANGNLLINGPQDHLNGAMMNSADKACQHLMPKIKPMTAAAAAPGHHAGAEVRRVHAHARDPGHARPGSPNACAAKGSR